MITSYTKRAPSSFLALACLWTGTLFMQMSSICGQNLNVDTFSSSVSPHQVFDVFFLDSTNGWMAVTDHNRSLGYILQTRDGGSSWRRVEAPSDIRQLFFTDSENGWALQWVNNAKLNGTSIHLLRTTDGGDHWNEPSMAAVITSTEKTHEYIISMAFTNKSDGWLVGGGAGASGFILRTKDGGMSFSRVNRSVPGCLGVSAGPKRGILVFGIGSVLRSVDDGEKWASSINPEMLGVNPDAFVMNSARFLQDGRGWLVGQAGWGAILATRDSGQSWHQEFEDKGGTLFEDLWVVDSKRRCAVGNTTLLFCTNNDGLAWSSTEVLPRPTLGQSRLFKRLVLLASGRGWVVRYGGYLYRTSDGGDTWQEFDPISK